MDSQFKFEILYESKWSGARVGRIHTAHGVIDTPNYVPVGTNGTLKACDNAMLAMHDCQLMFCNTYHLALHPGGGVIESAGGLHRFMGRDQPIITDSGGFQVFSLAYGSVASELKSQGCRKTDNAVVKISERGVKFRSYRDGAMVEFTPEHSIGLQKQLGADIIIPFDELPPFHVDEVKLRRSFERTHRWQKRSIDAHHKDRRGQAIYGVVHGGCDHDLRRKSCELLVGMGFDGFGIGGSLGKTKEDLYEILEHCMPHIPREAPRHLLGIADIPNIDRGVLYGIDTFDSCYPTRAARHAVLLLPEGRIKISSGRYKYDFGPIDGGCGCWTCRHYSRAYVHHLFKAYEPSAHTLATIHNVYQMMIKMRKIREGILQGKI